MGKPGAYVKSIKFNDGSVVDFNSDDIVIFVGGNNVGKSESLKEIYEMFRTGNSGIIIENIEREVINFESIKDYVTSNSIVEKNTYKGFKYSFGVYAFSKPRAGYEFYLSDFFSSLIKTDDRLAACLPKENLSSKNDMPENLPQFVAKYKTFQNKIDEQFYKTFNLHIECDTLTSKKIYFRISKNQKEFSGDSNKVIGEIANYYENLPTIETQGDGMKSFLSIVINLLIERYSLLLIDEPESFLHQPQALEIGNSIAKLSAGKQIFISSHSIQIILGLLSNNPERVKIIRLERIENEGTEINPVTILDNNHVSDLIRDPLLQYSNIFDGIFSDKIVLTESESDCRFYDVLFKHISRNNPKTVSYFFTLSHGKYKMPKIINAIQSLGVKSSIVFDIDIIGDSEILKKVVEEKGGEFSSIKLSVDKILSFLRAQNENPPTITFYKNEVEKILIDNAEEYLLESNRKKLNELFKKTTPFKIFKKQGRAYLDDETRVYFDQLISYLNSIGIFIVPVGELENFIPDIGGHGPSWVQNVFEKYPNLDDQVYKEATEFIKKL